MDKQAPAGGGKRSGRKARESKRERVLEVAARLFSSKGYAGTSIRDIANEVGILSGSLYYHFESKEAMLIAVHSKGVSQVVSAVEAALAATADGTPWERFSAACTAHLETLLSDSPFSQVVTPQFTRGFAEPMRSELIAQRDDYEALIARLVTDLPLPKAVDRRYFRLAILGSLNWTPTWYHPGQHQPKTIARKMLAAYRLQLDPAA